MCAKYISEINSTRRADDEQTQSGLKAIASFYERTSKNLNKAQSEHATSAFRCRSNELLCTVGTVCRIYRMLQSKLRHYLNLKADENYKSTI